MTGLEVIGVGNTVEAAQLHPALSSVGPADLFRKVADLIVEVAQSDGRRRPVRLDFPWQLYLRETSDQLHGSGALITAS